MNLPPTTKTAGSPASLSPSRPAFSRAKRIAFELLAPPAFGFAILAFPSALAATAHALSAPAVNLKTSLTFLVAGLFYAYLLAGIPSLVFAAVMEWRFARGLDPAGWCAVRLAAALGGCAGFAMAIFPHGRDLAEGAWLPVLMVSVVGGLVGAIVGGVIRWRSRVASRVAAG